MAHYPIKCTRCAHITSNNAVLFDTTDAILDMVGVLNNQNDEAEVQVLPKEENRTGHIDNESPITHQSRSIWDDFDEDDASTPDVNMSSAGQKSLKRFMTYSGILSYCLENRLDPPVPRYQNITVSKDFAGLESDENGLLMGVSFQKSKNGASYLAKRRFCPKCKCPLPAQSGSMPTYNITIMGTSASGKTVFLCALNRLLAMGRCKLPYNSDLTCVSANRANNDLVQRSNMLFEQGILPGTTQIFLTEPLVIQMTYNIQGHIKKCLVSMADMRGEDFVATGGENLIARGGFFSTADAFMILVSPLNIPFIANQLPQSRGTGANAGVHQALMSNINDYILPFFPDGDIKAPCAVTMSKCDILMNYANLLHIPLSNAVVAPEPPTQYTQTYFRNQDRGTRNIMQADNTLYNFLTNVFKKCYFTSFSSLGINAQISQGDDGAQVVTNPNFIRPIRVVDSMVYILMSLGFLPAFYNMEVGGEVNQRNNVAILNEWVRERT